jgi:hypothetical protein
MTLEETQEAFFAKLDASPRKRLSGPNMQPTMLGASPCDDCPHVRRCAAGLACESMKLFIYGGRISATAPRQPSAAIFRELFA